MNRREWLLALGAAPLLAAPTAAAATTAAPGAPRRWAQVDPRERFRQRYLPDVELQTHRGTTVTFYRDLIKDKVVVLNFMYTVCDGICPLVTRNLTKVQALLGDRAGRDIFLYSLTLKPEQDTVPVLARYAETRHIGPGWTLLTGRPADLEMLRRRLGFTDPDPAVDKDKSNHIGNLRYGNEALMRWGSCPGMSNPEWIHKSILWVDWPQETQKGDRA
jgi:protein SCO1